MFVPNHEYIHVYCIMFIINISLQMALKRYVVAFNDLWLVVAAGAVADKIFFGAHFCANLLNLNLKTP